MKPLNEIFTLPNCLVYLLGVNLVTFLLMYIDKKRAQNGEWRISEAALFGMVLLGGGMGGIAGMYLFRHKTKKLKFTIGFPVILIGEIILVSYLCFFK